MKQLIFLFMLAAMLGSCSSTDTETITIRGKYSIDIPQSLKQTKALNPDAALQYMDAARDLYVIVIDEQKQDVANAIVEYGLENTYTADLNGYSKLLADRMKLNLKDGTITPFKDTEINGLKARKAGLDGIVESIRIHYSLCVIEGESRFYQIMVWTTPERLEGNTAEMQAIINSFKEIGGSVAN